MAENVPPGSASKSAVADTEKRGIPYYEKLRRDLRDTLQKKRALDKTMAHIEEQIYRHETTYLEDTSTAGNIIKGFDNYIKSSTGAVASSGGGGTISGSAAGGGPGAGRRKTAVSEVDRVFSRSSATYRDSDSPSSAQSTPIHTGTPTGAFSAGHEKGDKKKKKVIVTEESETDGGRANKRQKITFGPQKRGHDD